MQKHTPGPWLIVRYGKETSQYKQGYRFIVTEDGWFIAEGYTGEANARLIAAAPELYQSCIELLAFPNNEVLKEKARKAIAKAEGR